MAFPTDASVVVLLGSWWDASTRAGMEATITATPVPAGGSGAPANATPNLTDLANYGWIKSRSWVTKPLESGLYALPLIANDDPDLSAFGGYLIAPQGEPSFLVNVSVTATTIAATPEIVSAITQASQLSSATYSVAEGDQIQVVRMTEAAVLSQPAPQPPAAFLTEQQINSRIATAITDSGGGGLQVDQTGAAVGTLSGLRKRGDGSGYDLEPAAEQGSAFAALRTPPQFASFATTDAPTVGAVGGSHDITGGVTIAAAPQDGGGVRPNAGPFNYYGCGGLVLHGSGYPDNFFVRSHFITDGNLPTSPQALNVGFWYDGTELAICYKGFNSAYRILVNGQVVTSQNVTTDGTVKYQKLTWATRAPRFVQVEGSTFLWGGVVIQPAGTLTPAQLRKPRCIIVGDSFTEGTGATLGAASSFARTFGDLMGWPDTWASGLGGTGLLKTNGARVTFRDRIQADVIDHAPDVVVVAGGYNDYADFTAAAIGTEAGTLFDQLKTGLPNAIVVVLSPWWKGGPSTLVPALMATRDAIRAAAAARGLPFVDLLQMPMSTEPTVTTLAADSAVGATTLRVGQAFSPGAVIQVGTDEWRTVTAAGGGAPGYGADVAAMNNAHPTGTPVVEVGRCFWTGSGRSGNPAGDGNSDVYVGNDGTHPTQTGHDALGRVLAGLVTAAAL